MVLIGIGQAGHNLIQEFGEHHKKISILAKDFPKKCKKVEDYEEFCPSFTKRLKFTDDECWVALCGAGKVSGCTLRALESIKHKSINIIYIYPDPNMITPMQAKRNYHSFNVMQQYTRSGLFRRMYLFSNEEIISVIGEQSIINMYSMINKQIANAIETVEWFNTQDPIMGSPHTPKEISRICTLSVGDFQKNEEKLLFPLDNTTETGYIYSISKTQLEKNKDLLTLIKGRIIEDEKNNITSSFAIYPSQYKKSFFYSLKLSHIIQTLETK
tara:strand:+ start:69 stop:881 length:813 start_codon:yes stop_codon:yes gene_type:complete